MRHAFSFPQTVRDAVRQHVYRAYSGLPPERYAQEHAWVAALAGRLDGVAYNGHYGTVVFTSTVVNDRGPGAAEHEFGADLAITATISDGVQTVRKAILLQAKRGAVADLSPGERQRLDEQIRRMRQLTRFPKVLEIPETGGLRTPRVRSGARLEQGLDTEAVALEDYFTGRVLTTLDGDTREPFVYRVQRSALAQIDVKAFHERRSRDGQQLLF